MIENSYKYPNIRISTIKMNPSNETIEILTDNMFLNKWEVANNKSLLPVGKLNSSVSLFSKFSGVCYMFGLELHKKLNV